MELDGMFKAMEISASGLQAEWMRTQVIANNIANAETTQTPEGGPYRRREIVFSTVLDQLNGVQVKGVVSSTAPPRKVYDPGHPDADSEGFVSMPDIKLPLEMVDMLAASRAYQANLAMIRNFKSVAEETIKLLR